MGHPTKTVSEYMDEVLEEYVIAEDEKQVILDVSKEEAMVFGIALIRFNTGFFKGLKQVRFLHEVGETARVNEDDNEIEDDEIDKDEEAERKNFIN